ncbi:hypothetical protein [Anaeromyxobacter diazotrophicus]|uniref:Lipoprotein n=1 Tax=Anaeromyxobacter diazotrophicus TaxID=2590199 RepID=A0A7I9VL15_9BACT|nr:hypothetical protein [Anaeromyxobacter diazotrophicus]GEJ57091.1 hypothetical protein AMYX_18320 [Anaeromyxobacter diazotrophicus]
MPRLRNPSALLALALLASLALSCASLAGAKRESALRRELNGYQLPRPLAAVWPDALRVLSERGVQLVGRDRATVGQPEQNTWGQLLSKGFETREDGGGRWVAESNADGERRRFRVQGTDLGRGTSIVRYVSIQAHPDDPAEDEARAIDLELALVQRVDPGAAARMLAAAPP